MSELNRLCDDYVSLLRKGQTLELIERFYDDEVVVFENRELARAGQKACLRFEREQLAKQERPSHFRVLKSAVNEEAQVVFLECVVRFAGPEGRPMRLEQVAVQRWSNGRITEERFYYEGIVDEGNEQEDDEEDDTLPR